MKRLFSLLLVAVVAVNMVACANNTKPTNPTTGNDTISYVDPYKNITDYDELSIAIYEDVLGDFYAAYQTALAEENVPTR